MRTELHTTSAVFGELAERWDRLLDPDRSDNMFMCNDWQRIWWQHLHTGELAVVSVWEGDELHGVGSWFIVEEEDQAVIHQVGCEDITDYLDILAQPGWEEQVIQALLDFLLSEDAPDWDVVDLCNIPESSPTYELLPQLAKSAGLSVSVNLQEVCPVVTLPDTYEEYLSDLDKKQRHELRRKRRKAEGYGIRWYMVGPDHKLSEEIDAFLELMAASAPKKAAFLEEPGHKAFFHDMGQVFFEKDLLRLIFLTVNDERVAAMWQFQWRDRMLLYNSGIDPEGYAALSPGIVLQTYSVEDAINRHLTWYDYLRGDETYKYRMGAEDTRVHNIVFRR